MSEIPLEENTKASPLVSIIVCTYDRAKLLERCLAGLIHQGAPRDLFEVIVVDNNSADNTRDVVCQYIKENENFRYVLEEKQGLSHARNKGCDKARADYLVYLDDDAVPSHEYLKNILDVIERYRPDILGGPVYPFYLRKKPVWFSDVYETKKYENASGFSKTCLITGANYTIKKDVLRQLGMFDVNLGMKAKETGLFEERKVLESYRRVTPETEQKVYYSLDCYIWHYIPEYKMKLSYFLKRRFIGGRMWVGASDIIGLAEGIRELKRLFLMDRNGDTHSHSLTKIHDKKIRGKECTISFFKLPLMVVAKICRMIKLERLRIIDLFIRAMGASFFYSGLVAESVRRGTRKYTK